MMKNNMTPSKLNTYILLTVVGGFGCGLIQTLSSKKLLQPVINIGDCGGEVF